MKAHWGISKSWKPYRSPKKNHLLELSVSFLSQNWVGAWVIYTERIWVDNSMLRCTGKHIGLSSYLSLEKNNNKKPKCYVQRVKVDMRFLEVSLMFTEMHSKLIMDNKGFIEDSFICDLVYWLSSFAKQNPGSRKTKLSDGYKNARCVNWRLETVFAVYKKKKIFVFMED